MKKGILALFVLSVTAAIFYSRWRPSPPDFSRCDDAFVSLFKKDVVPIKVFFGYKDGRPARFVGDRYERLYFIQLIQKMGFERSGINEDLFTRKTTGTFLNRHRMELEVIGSSVGPDDDENAKDPFQKWQSAYAKARFKKALKETGGVFYNGHSRDGGGPDFEPPRCREGKRVDYPWYRKEKPGFKTLLETDEREEGPSVIGLFSCFSNRHFSRSLSKARPHTALLVSDQLLYYGDALSGLLGTLSQLIEMKCYPSPLPEGMKALGFFTSIE